MRPDASMYEVLHEIGHYLHYLEIGPDEWMRLKDLAGQKLKERRVLEMMETIFRQLISNDEFRHAVGNCALWDVK